jgi:asparagine synthase (glutamine-hydrolysing)|tara:strand:+ start:950 stop:1195 length:246 start_codon:yes stop_codon:yes gene_type:complete
MCGISGIISRINPGDRAVVESMNAIQAHRGPDMDKVCEYNGAVLGHRRLSIIDLDDRSSQPMESRDGRYAIVFNGEIYNYK